MDRVSCSRKEMIFYTFVNSPEAIVSTSVEKSINTKAVDVRQ